MAAPVCPINRSQPAPVTPPARQPAIPVATDLPSLIRAVNIINDIVRDITTSLVVNNTRDVNIGAPRDGADGTALPVPPIPPNNYRTSNYPDWQEKSATTRTGFIFNHNLDTGKTDKNERAYVLRTGQVQFVNDQSDTDGPFKWSYSHAPDAPIGDSKGQPPFQEDFFERVVNVSWLNEPPVFWIVGTGFCEIVNGLAFSVGEIFTSSDGKHWTGSASNLPIAGGGDGHSMGNIYGGCWMRAGLAPDGAPTWILAGNNDTNPNSSAACSSTDGKTVGNATPFDNLHYAEYFSKSGQPATPSGPSGAPGLSGPAGPPDGTPPTDGSEPGGPGDSTPPIVGTPRMPAGPVGLDDPLGGVPGDGIAGQIPGAPAGPPEPGGSTGGGGGSGLVSVNSVISMPGLNQPAGPFSTSDGQSWSPDHYYPFDISGRVPLDGGGGDGGDAPAPQTMLVGPPAQSMPVGPSAYSILDDIANSLSATPGAPAGGPEAPSGPPQSSGNGGSVVLIIDVFLIA